ncbi:MAG: PQQ-dependent dehydrogenase, methanol/ethanol family [Gammaproteobacteria bacterium]
MPAWLPLAAAAHAFAGSAVVDGAHLRDDARAADWASDGRTYSEWHYSPLREIDASSVQRLGLAWSLDLDTLDAVSTPLAVDGVLYVAAGLSVVHAIDAASGRLLWRYDPEVAKVAGVKLRYGHGVRGLAFWKGRLYVGTKDGRLIALNAADGSLAWSVVTTEPGDDRTISGAPRVFNGKVVIGNRGTEEGRLGRGFLTCYDADTGRQLWRFWTVPGNPADGFEHDALAMAARTWTGQWWKYKGGGAAWNAITYDPDFNRIYFGTGNAAPYNWKIRSPGGGDNLFTASILALDADTGAYAWHYQTVPGDAWDFDTAMDLQLATLAIDGAPRKVLLHAPKNGFFYVIDRANGKVLSAEKFARVTWAERIDLATGRPVEAPNIRFENGPSTFWPGPIGAHAWQPMSFSPRTGLVYIPRMEMPGYFSDRGIDPKTWQPIPGAFNTGLESSAGEPPEDWGTSALVAWDPVRQRPAWKVDHPGMWNGGTLALGGDLVFQGLGDGTFNAYSATSGARLWSFGAGAAVIAAPISYLAGGRQQITVLAGPHPSSAGAFGAVVAKFGWDYRRHPRRVLTFVLDGKAALPATPAPGVAQPLDDPALVLDAATEEAGRRVYAPYCTGCHGIGAISGGSAPDLRASAVALDRAGFRAAVRGALESRGMPRFDELNDEAIESIRLYVRARARAAIAGARAPGAAPPRPVPGGAG